MPSTNRKHTKRPESSSSKNYPYSRNTKELARNEGHTVSRLLWQKILSSSSPRVQDMLMIFLDLRDMLRFIIPEEYVHSTKEPVDHKQLATQIREAEKFLTHSDKDTDNPG